MKILLYIGNKIAPEICESEVVPKEGAIISVENHRVRGEYIVNQVEYTYNGTQPENIDHMKLDADIRVYLGGK